MKMKVVFALVCALQMSAVAAETGSPQWMQKGAPTGYQVHGSGDAASAEGATASVMSTDADAGKKGIATAISDATPFRGKVVILQADLSVHDAETGAAVFVGVLGPEGNLGFATSAWVPVLGDVAHVHRELKVAVPSTATKINYGVELRGNGTVTAEGIKLVARDAMVEVPPQMVLDRAIQIVRDYALNAGKLDWAVVEPRIRAMAAKAKVSQDVYPAIRALLVELGDHHSFFEPPSVSAFLTTQGGPKSQPVVEMKAGGVGYISMPGYSGGDMQMRRAFANTMVTSISGLAPQARCGWVVDLRPDSGGSMVPMIAGLEPLLGDATLGGFRDAKGHVNNWKVGYGLGKDVPKGIDLSHARVAVLYGPHTASSGEIVAISFRGRADTRSFGAPTAGLSTANANFSLPDGSTMIVTTAVDLDRDGHAYGDKIQPDQLVETADSKNDAVLNASMTWLAQAGQCKH